MKKNVKNQFEFDTYYLSKDEHKKLLSLGNDAVKYTYPESGKGFAVAIMTEKGNLYAGASYASDPHNLTMHSEAVALARAA